MATYMIKNIVTGNFYIGSTVNYSNRVAVHTYLMKKGMHTNRRIREDCEKHGWDSFRFEIINTFSIKSQLIPAEQKLIDSLKPQYNIAPTAGSCLGLKASQEARERMSIARIGSKNFWYGKKPPCCKPGKSEEVRKKISNSRLGKKNPMYGVRPSHAKLSDEDVLKIRLLCDSGKTYVAVATEFGVSKACIASIIQGRSYKGVV